MSVSIEGNVSRVSAGKNRKFKNPIYYPANDTEISYLFADNQELWIFYYLIQRKDSYRP